MNEQYFFSLPLDQREAYFFKQHPIAQLLKDVLLGIGGEQVIWTNSEPHLMQLIKDGARFPLHQIKLFKGKDNRCHTNVAQMFLDKNVGIATGYGLSSDGLWRSHSWGVSMDGKRVIETTSPRTAYYGVQLQEMDITKFVWQELGNDMMSLSEKQLEKLPMPKIILQKEAME